MDYLSHFGLLKSRAVSMRDSLDGIVASHPEAAESFRALIDLNADVLQIIEDGLQAAGRDYAVRVAGTAGLLESCPTDEDSIN